MRFIPHTADDVRAMLDHIGVADIDDLFENVPIELRRSATLALAPGRTELEVRRHLESLAAKNSAAAAACFAGAGAYPHFVPAVVDQILQRAEFYSAYTPYQPEVSQGTLQAIFEFQTIVSMLLGLDVANASMYDGASATAEAVLMAARVRNKRRRVIVSRAVHPHYRETITTYLEGAGLIDVVEAPIDAQGRTDGAWLAQNIDEQTAAVVLGYPNFFGVIEDVAAVAAIAHAREALVITATSEAVALGLLKSPGELGADIAVAEGQSLGIPMSYGGPGVGLFATRSEYVRMMPGRLVGEANDTAGRRGYVLTLATREQHIRREKATSNICTNQGLMSLAFTVHVCALGKQGIRNVALANTAAAHRLAQRLGSIKGLEVPFQAPFFNEFVIRGKRLDAARAAAQKSGLLAGISLSRWYPEFGDAALLCVTEVHEDSAIDALVRAFETAAK